MWPRLFILFPDAQGKEQYKGLYGITACFVKGGKKIVDNIQKKLGIKPGQTTNDRKYSLQVTRCVVGACGIAPVIIINDTIYKKVDPSKVMDIVYSLE
ncbi:MAG: NAD(P)H-dependent oxidoreductase subunit E [Actinomycetota bacterium]|nr:NAD(P)H-dependent oxidoreductase subunit E [Actinomycetota bacterium]